MLTGLLALKKFSPDLTILPARQGLSAPSGLLACRAARKSQEWNGMVERMKHEPAKTGFEGGVTTVLTKILPTFPPLAAASASSTLPQVAPTGHVLGHVLDVPWTRQLQPRGVEPASAVRA